MLTDKIRLSGPESDAPEDILSSCLAVIFPDDITTQHGDRENSVIYLSPTFGSIKLSLADPQGEVSRKLFSHFVWNAGLQLAEFIEESRGGEAGERADWSVEGEKVLELGAGAGLAGIIAALSGAREVVLTDYPAQEVLQNIRDNVSRNIEPRKKGSGESARETNVSVQGHEWGLLENDAFSEKNKGGFGTILCADCMWMPWEHLNLLKSIAWFMKDGGRAWVVAALHTGRQKMRGFFEEEKLQETGLVIERIWERDATGKERAWVSDRGIEDVTERKRWLVIAILRRRIER